MQITRKTRKKEVAYELTLSNNGEVFVDLESFGEKFSFSENQTCVVKCDAVERSFYSVSKTVLPSRNFDKETVPWTKQAIN